MSNVVESSPGRAAGATRDDYESRSQGVHGRPPRFPAQPATALHATFLAMSVAVIAASFLLSVHPTDKVTLPLTSVQLPSVCQFRNMTSLDCPGCGLTRAFIHIAHGDVVGAWRYNAASILMFAFVLAQIPYRSVQLWRIRRGLPELDWRRAGNWMLAVVTTALVVQWLVKLVWIFFA